MTLQPKCEDVETAEGVAITVTGVAQVNHHTFLGMPAQPPLTAPTPFPSFVWHHPIITAEVVFIQRAQVKMHTCTFDQDAKIDIHKDV